MASIRDTPAGQLLRKIGFKSWLYYPEEVTGFELPNLPFVSQEIVATKSEIDLKTLSDASTDVEKSISKVSLRLGTPSSDAPTDVETTPSKKSLRLNTPPDDMSIALSQKGLTTTTVVSCSELEGSPVSFSELEGSPMSFSQSEPIVVSFTEDDPDNPRNWSKAKKTWTITLINVYTFVVYCTASIITPTAGVLMKRYDISIIVASLGLSLYVVGYGIGPMIFSPLGEVASIGRNPPYLYSFILFFIVSVILAFVDSFPAFAVLRLLQGFFGSPCLASGAASIEDVYDMYQAPYGYIWWVASMYCGPAFGPLLGGYAVPHNWRWPLYEIIIMGGIVLIFLPFLPETSPQTILLNRARRLRKATGKQTYKAPSELRPKLPFGQRAHEVLNKPLEITFKDPAVAYACVYGSLVYAIYYSFFEAFPLVYVGTYGMSLGGMGLIFLALTAGCVIGLSVYYVYITRHFIPKARAHHAEKGEPVAQEQWLLTGLFGVWGPPAGLLLFAWTAREDIHFMVPTIGIGIFAASTFFIFQSLICYVALSYPKYVASLFAANDCARSLVAAAFVQVSHQMYSNLGIDRGVTLVAGLSVAGIFGMYGLYYFGSNLRARSRFTG